MVRISSDVLEEVISYHGKLDIGDRFRYRVRNISEGLAIGTYAFIAGLQKKFQRKFIRPRSFCIGSFFIFNPCVATMKPPGEGETRYARYGDSQETATYSGFYRKNNFSHLATKNLPATGR